MSDVERRSPGEFNFSDPVLVESRIIELFRQLDRPLRMDLMEVLSQYFSSDDLKELSNHILGLVYERRRKSLEGGKLKKPTKKKLKERDHQVLGFIEGFIDLNGYSPSLEQIEMGVGYAPNTTAPARRAVGRLEKEGFLVRERGAQRSITLIKKTDI